MALDESFQLSGPTFRFHLGKTYYFSIIPQTIPLVPALNDSFHLYQFEFWKCSEVRRLISVKFICDLKIVSKTSFSAIC